MSSTPRCRASRSPEVRTRSPAESQSDRPPVADAFAVHDLYAGHKEERHGPYRPLGAPVALERFRRHRKSRREEKVERIDDLAARIGLPRAVLSGEEAGLSAERTKPVALGAASVRRSQSLP